jgi:probable F420-dependent oxidoreductase
MPDPGPVGLWTFALDRQPAARAQELAAELEGLGYDAVWVPEAVGRDPLVHAALLLSATERLTVATGIASIHARTPLAMSSGWRTLSEAFPGRFVLGLGVSHAPMVEGLLQKPYGKPLTAMREYLDAMDAAIYAAAPPPDDAAPRRVLAALGPKMLELARDRADGAHPYNITPDHTARAREVLGAGKWLAPEQAVALETDPEAARAIGRAHLAVYLGLPNYTNNLLRLGFTEDDITAPGSDRLVDALVAWGDVDTIAARVREHHDAGADHVAVQVVTADAYEGLPLPQWRELAPALTG